MTKKVSKESVDYRKGSGNLLGKQCSNCAMFRMTVGKHNGSCTHVEGDIERTYVCNDWSLWKPGT